MLHLCDTHGWQMTKNVERVLLAFVPKSSCRTNSEEMECPDGEDGDENVPVPPDRAGVNVLFRHSAISHWIPLLFSPIRALRNKQLVLRRVKDEMRIHCVRQEVCVKWTPYTAPIMDNSIFRSEDKKIELKSPPLR